MMGRMMPTTCRHGLTVDWGDFGPCQDCDRHPGEHCPNLVDCQACLRERSDVKPFCEAEIGDEAYTWENDGGSWGDYAFETVDPFHTGAADDCNVVTRKRWRLIAVEHFPDGSEP